MEEYHRIQFASIDEDKISDDTYLCELANQRRIKLYSSPTQSFFRVYALIICLIPNESKTDSGTNLKYFLIDGANCEQGVGKFMQNKCRVCLTEIDILSC